MHSYKRVHNWKLKNLKYSLTLDICKEYFIFHMTTRYSYFFQLLTLRWIVLSPDVIRALLSNSLLYSLDWLVRMLDFKNIRLSDGNIVIMSDPHNIRLSSCQTIKLSDYQAVRLSSCQTVRPALVTDCWLVKTDWSASFSHQYSSHRRPPRPCLREERVRPGENFSAPVT